VPSIFPIFLKLTFFIPNSLQSTGSNENITIKIFNEIRNSFIFAQIFIKELIY